MLITHVFACFQFLSPGKNLKVRNPEKYGWEPRRVLSQLVDIYLHLDHDVFASALASDEVIRVFHVFIHIVWLLPICLLTSVFCCSDLFGRSCLRMLL